MGGSAEAETDEVEELYAKGAELRSADSRGRLSPHKPEMVRKIVKARIAQNEGNGSGGSRRTVFWSLIYWTRVEVGTDFGPG